jgi:tRNA-dihydrouridine synthase 1
MGADELMEITNPSADDTSSKKGSNKSKKKKKDKSSKKKNKKRKHDDKSPEKSTKEKKKRKLLEERSQDVAVEDNQQQLPTPTTKQHFPFQYQHILAPMVGASELAFRLLCRKYGATLSYTPMMSASEFVQEAATAKHGITNSNICEFQTIPQDRPLVCHFSANDPQDFARAAALVEPYCDAIDLNLGCPQRTAYLGHFGSYLLGKEDRQLIIDIIRAGSKAVSKPIFVKIRLLDTIEETLELCHQLRDAGASLIAIHARYRASWERTGPGARDGPAMLDKVKKVKESMPDFPIISNGNVITYDDVVNNQSLTGADGIMSAEGILNNPALYLPRLGDLDKDGERSIELPILTPLNNGETNQSSVDANDKASRKLNKKLREIIAIEQKIAESGEDSINDDQRSKLQAKSKVQAKLLEIENSSRCNEGLNQLPESDATPQTTAVKLRDLAESGRNPLALAQEYISLVKQYPMKIRSVVFHTRRMCKDLFEKYQLMEECIACTSVEEVEVVLSKCAKYVANPQSFHYDQEKAARDKEALENKRLEEGKRKRYEDRMIRKAKREGLSDLHHYLRMGAEVPSIETLKKLKKAPKEERFSVWKKNHSQHCMAHHLEEGGCKRDRSCAFIHVAATSKLIFVEDAEVAG